MPILESRYRRSYGIRGQKVTDTIGGGGSGCGLPSEFVSCTIFSSSVLLNVAFPASSNSASFGLVYSGSQSLPRTYQSDGVTWNVLGGGSSGMSLTVTTVTTNATAAGFNCILVNASSNPVTITLPAAASSPSSFYIIKKIDETPNHVVVQPTGGEKIEGLDYYGFNNDGEDVQVVTDGTRWFII